MWAGKCVWVNQQHELILAVNRWALKGIKASAEKSVFWAGGKALEIPIGNLVLLRDHPEGHNKIQDNYKNTLCHGIKAPGPKCLYHQTTSW